MLSSEERRNASSKARRDALEACARAAQAQVWAEVARYGPGYLTSSANLDAPIDLVGYGQLAAPAHYDSTTSMRVDQVVSKIVGASSDGTPAAVMDLTNGEAMKDNLTGGGRVYRMAARCTDTHGNSFEVEFSMRFALF
jgi:hypothetical protein